MILTLLGILMFNYTTGMTVKRQAEMIKGKGVNEYAMTGHEGPMNSNRNHSEDTSMLTVALGQRFSNFLCWAAL